MTTTKTEDDIARDKEAVEKMKGAKGAMEAALRRIDTLETTLRNVVPYLDECKKATSPNVAIRTFYHGGSQHESQVAMVHQVIDGAKAMIAKAL